MASGDGDFYEIVRADNISAESSIEDLYPHVPDPIAVKGSGHITIFGLSNRFDSEFPQQLTGKIAPEEFRSTIYRVNKILNKFISLNFIWFLIGCLCCCCTAGISIWPVLCLDKRSKRMLEKALDWENRNLYHKLGLHWKLDKQRLANSTMIQYVLLIEYIPKTPVYKPD